MSSKAGMLGLLLAAAVGSPAAMAQQPKARDLAVTVDLSRRQLEVRVDGRLRGRYPVAVGKVDHRTPVGTYKLSQVIWNPTWVPPADAWAEDKEPKAAGEPGNPMGRVKILFGPELYVHGTRATGTLGEPASHGCIRMSNRSALRLARLVMEYGGARKPAAWYAKVEANPKETVEVAIPNPPALRISD